MKRYLTTTVIGLPAAERVMAAHIAALRVRSYEAQCINRGTIQRFLAYCHDASEQPADRRGSTCPTPPLADAPAGRCRLRGSDSALANYCPWHRRA